MVILGGSLLVSCNLRSQFTVIVCTYGARPEMNMISNHGQDTGLYPQVTYSMLLSKVGNAYKEMNRKCISFCLHLKSALFSLLTKPIVDCLCNSIQILHGKHEYKQQKEKNKHRNLTSTNQMIHMRHTTYIEWSRTPDTQHWEHELVLIKLSI